MIDEWTPEALAAERYERERCQDLKNDERATANLNEDMCDRERVFRARQRLDDRGTPGPPGIGEPYSGTMYTLHDGVLYDWLDLYDGVKEIIRADTQTGRTEG